MSMINSTAERIRAILVKDYKLDPAQITPDAQLAELGVDSLGIAELMFNIEDEFGVEMTTEPSHIASFNDVVQFIDALIAAKAAANAALELRHSNAGNSSINSSIGHENGVPLAP